MLPSFTVIISVFLPFINLYNELQIIYYTGYQITTAVNKPPMPSIHNTLMNGDASNDGKLLFMNGTHLPNNVTPIQNHNATNGVVNHDPNLIKSLLANKVRSGIAQNSHIPLLQVDGAASPHNPIVSDTHFDFKPITQLDGATTPPPSPNSKSHTNRSSQLSPPPRLACSPCSISPRATSPKVKTTQSVSPHASHMSPPMSPSGRSPKAKYNLEICVHAAKAAEVVPENHQLHEKRIERVENQCSPSKLDMNAELVKQLQGDQGYSMNYELEAPKAHAVVMGSNGKTNCDIGETAIDTSVDIELVTVARDSQTCSNDLVSPTLPSSVVIASDKSDVEIISSIVDVKTNNGIHKDNKLLAAIKDTLLEESELLKKGDIKNGLKQQLLGFNSHNVNNLSTDVTVGMVVNPQITLVNTPTPTYPGSILAAHLTGQSQTQPILTTPALATPTHNISRPLMSGQTCATNSMGQTVMVRLATPQNPTSQTFLGEQSNPTVTLVNQSVSLVNKSMPVGITSMGGQIVSVPYISSSHQQPSITTTLTTQQVTPQQISLNSVMSAVSQSQVNCVQPQIIDTTIRTSNTILPTTADGKRLSEQTCQGIKKFRTDELGSSTLTSVPALNTTCAYTCRWNHCNR